MTNPQLLIMDEPSEGLAPLLIRELGSQLSELKAATTMSILLVEQNLQLALRLADDVYVIERGRIVYQGSPAELDANAEVKQRYLGVG
jgi:branched-chain amino acid transport system ATP-binding protein